MSTRPALTKDQIRDRLQAVSASLTTTLTALFASVVDEGVERNIVAIYIFGDGTASRTVDLAYGSERTATIFDNVPVGPNERALLPDGGLDLETPIVVLAGGENIRGSQNAGSGVTVTLIFWDTEAWSTVT